MRGDQAGIAQALLHPTQGRAQAVGTLVHACPLGGPSTQPPGELPRVPRARRRPRLSVHTHLHPFLELAPSLWVPGGEAAWGQGQADAVKERRWHTLWAESQAGSVVTLPGAHPLLLPRLGGTGRGVSLLCLGRGSRKPLGAGEPALGETPSAFLLGQKKAPERGWQRPGLGSHCRCGGQFGLSTPADPSPPPQAPGRHQAVRLPPSSL